VRPVGGVSPLSNLCKPQQLLGKIILFNHNCPVLAPILLRGNITTVNSPGQENRPKYS
jgi:hypothetical protein